LEIQLLRDEGWDPINGLTPTHFCSCLNQYMDFQCDIVVGFTTNYAISAYDH